MGAAPLACQESAAPAGGQAAAHFSGAELYQRLACHGCHSRRGLGGSLGPPLDRVDAGLSRQEVAAQLLAPRRTGAVARMPSFAFLKAHELEELATFVHEDDQ